MCKPMDVLHSDMFGVVFLMFGYMVPIIIIGIGLIYFYAKKMYQKGRLCMKRCISFLLTLFLVVSILPPFSVLAATNSMSYTEKDLEEDNKKILEELSSLKEKATEQNLEINSLTANL